jgi:DNA/RNA-binding domain of Phe-tRNA-synthetase-like protein
VSAEETVGWCAPEVSEEFPELRLVLAQMRIEPTISLTGGSPPQIHERLRSLSDRWAGAQAVTVRRRAVPAAYRVFYRQIGLDPDVRRTPLEIAVLERMMRGGFLSRGLLADILTIALVDTGVPVWALDGETLEGSVGLRVSRAGELLGAQEDVRPPAVAQALAGGRLVVADAARALALLFDEPPSAHAVRAHSRALVLFAVQVAGVSTLHVEEALWSCLTALEWVGREPVE